MNLFGYTTPFFCWILSLQMFNIITQISSDGRLQLQLLSYSNDRQLQEMIRRGNPCNCNHSSSSLLSSSSSSSLCLESFCSTSLRICLIHFSPNSSANCKDKISFFVTSLNSSSSVANQSTEVLLEFPFQFAWPGMLTMTFEAEAMYDKAHMIKNKSDNTESAFSDEIFRVTVHQSLEPGKQWQNYIYYNQSSSLSSSSSSSSSVWLHYAYRVICDDGYYGSKCVDSCKSRNDKYGHYYCDEKGQRKCIGGWNGSYCDTAICLHGCHQKQGFCTEPNECRCRLGWQGRLCDKCIPYPGCQHGTCLKPWQCNCLDGWGGLYCNQDLMFCSHYKPCRSGSTCLNTGIGGYTCACPSGFTGINCDVEMQKCNLLSCLNGATCVVRSGTEKCECRPGFYGVRCEIVSKQSCAAQSNLCANGATCVATARLTDHNDRPIPSDGNLVSRSSSNNRGYSCICSSGFTGTNCEVDIKECFSDPCQNGGSCIDGQNRYQCLCPVGFDGFNCEINTNECSVNLCLNGGSCIDKINDYECRCLPGFVGILCQDDVDECLNRPCANGATCRHLINDFVCFCAPGFAGRYCTDNIDECSSGPCLNAGTCIDRINRFECLCDLVFYGDLCQHSSTLGSAKHVPDDSIRSFSSSSPASSVAIGIEVIVRETSSLSSGHADADGLTLTSVNQILLIICFGIAIPLILISAVLLLWIYRKRRLRSASVAVVSNRCRSQLVRLNNQSPVTHSHRAGMRNRDVDRGVVGEGVLQLTIAGASAAYNLQNCRHFDDFDEFTIIKENNYCSEDRTTTRLNGSDVIAEENTKNSRQPLNVTNLCNPLGFDQNILGGKKEWRKFGMKNRKSMTGDKDFESSLRGSGCNEGEIETDISNNSSRGGFCGCHNIPSAAAAAASRTSRADDRNNQTLSSSSSLQVKCSICHERILATEV